MARVRDALMGAPGCRGTRGGAWSRWPRAPPAGSLVSGSLTSRVAAGKHPMESGRLAAQEAVMWAFFLLATVYLEAAVALLFGLDAHIPGLQTWAPIGFVQDTIALACLLGLATFTVIRIKNNPVKLGRKSRFKGSHLG